MKIKYKTFSIYMLLIIGTVIFSCDFINPLFDDNGSLAIKCIINKDNLDKTSDTSKFPEKINRISCIIYKDGKSKESFDLKKEGNRFKESKKLKKGTYDITLDAYDESDTHSHTGTAEGVKVSPLKTTEVPIELVPVEVALTISANPSNAGSVSKNPNKLIYYYDDSVQLTASAAPGYQFYEWKGSLSGNSNPVNIKMNGDKNITAVFLDEVISTPNLLSGPSSGTVGQSLTFSTGGSTSNLGHPVQYRFYWGDGDTSSWGSSTQSHTYSTVGTYNIKAQARCQTHTSVLSSWSSTKTVTISGHTLSVSISPAGSGTVTKNPNKSSYNHNETVQLTASSSANYNFYQWTGGDLSGSNNPASITMNGSKGVTAVFSQDPIISGYVKDNAGNPIPAVTLTFSNNSETPTTNSSGYYSKTVPKGWSGTVTPSYGSSTFTPTYRSYSNVTTDQTNQNFTINEYISTPNTPTGPSSGTVGQSLTFSTGGSTSNLGHPIQYQFDWGDGSPKNWGSSTQSHSYLNVGTYNIKAQARCQTHTTILSSWSSAKTVTISGHTLTVSIIPAGSGTVAKSPNKTSYNHNETVQLTASPSASYQFDHWEGDLSSNANPASATMNGNKNVTAVFIPLDLVAYYPFNGNADDGSGNGNHGTVNGATLTSDRFGNSNEAYYFDGNGDYIDCGDGSTLKISGEITVCAWVNLQANSHGQVIVNKYNRTENKGWLLEITSDGYAIFAGRPGPGGEMSNSGLSPQSVFDNNWHFLVGQRQGTSWKIYIDGILCSQNAGLGDDFSNSTNLYIGVQSDRPTDPAAFSQGIIDDVRIYGYALSETEIQKHYTEGGWPLLIAFYPFNGNANDESGNGNHGTVNGATLTTDRFSNSNKAFYFDGVDDLINCGHKSSLQLTSALTISAWFSSNVSDILGEYLIGKCDRVTPSYEYCICWDYHSGSIMGLKTCVGGQNNDETGSNFVPSDNEWHHVVVTFSYPGQLKMYLDGNDLNIDKTTSGLIEPTLQDVVIGCIRPSGEPSMRNFSGKIDDIRIYNRVISLSEIQALYHEGGW